MTCPQDGSSDLGAGNGHQIGWDPNLMQHEFFFFFSVFSVEKEKNKKNGSIVIIRGKCFKHFLEVAILFILCQEKLSNKVRKNKTVSGKTIDKHQCKH